MSEMTTTMPAQKTEVTRQLSALDRFLTLWIFLRGGHRSVDRGAGDDRVGERSVRLPAALLQTNCKQCGQPTCFTFALKLAAAQARLEDCPPLLEPEYADRLAQPAIGQKG